MAKEPSYTGMHLDATALRVLAHPLRSRLLSTLRSGGPATATDLAARLGTNSGATSYHLRKLESVGLVTDTGEGEGKRRLWRPSTDSHQFDASDFAGDEDAETALSWLVRDYVHQFTERYEHWLDVQESWPLVWRDALGMSDTFVTATPERLRAMYQEIDEIFTRYRRIDEGDPEARRIHVQLAMYPRDATPPAVPDPEEGGS